MRVLSFDFDVNMYGIYDFSLCTYFQLLILMVLGMLDDEEEYYDDDDVHLLLYYQMN